MRRPAPPIVVLVCCGAICVTDLEGQSRQAPPFRADVTVVSLAVTVTDAHGRFVSNLSRDDFVVYDDGRPQPLVHFAAERTPVSLGLVVDASGSMAGDKMEAAREALRRFVEDLLGPEDEVFLDRFNDTPQRLQRRTRDRAVLRDRINAIRPSGGTALYDAVVDAVSEAHAGTHRKRALVVVSDGNDTHSSSTVEDVRQRMRETDVLLYAVGIDGEDEGPRRLPPAPRGRWPGGFPLPQPGVPGGGRRPPMMPPPTDPGPQPLPWPPIGGRAAPRDDRVNAKALRAMTDDSGGRTEIIRTAADLRPATAGIADELSRHYTLAFAPGDQARANRWHSIRVEVRNRTYHVRARRGYVY